jgi:hypothetical protein
MLGECSTTLRQTPTDVSITRRLLPVGSNDPAFCRSNWLDQPPVRANLIHLYPNSGTTFHTTAIRRSKQRRSCGGKRLRAN